VSAIGGGGVAQARRVPRPLRCILKEAAMVATSSCVLHALPGYVANLRYMRVSLQGSGYMPVIE